MSDTTTQSGAVNEHRRLKEKPQPQSADAVAMRRIVAETGYWLSPMLKDYPLPVLTEWEQSVDLAKLGEAKAHPSKQKATHRHGANTGIMKGLKAMTVYEQAEHKQTLQRAQRKRREERIASGGKVRTRNCRPDGVADGVLANMTEQEIQVWERERRSKRTARERKAKQD